jgi:hypothetical protein
MVRFEVIRNPHAARRCERWIVRKATGRKGIVLKCRNGAQAHARCDALNLLSPLMAK